MRLRRREFIEILGIGLVAACVGEVDDGGGSGDGDDEGGADAGPGGGGADAGGVGGPADAASAPGADACVESYVTMYDTNAQALYMDGTLGPLTGVIKVDYVLAGVEITLDFWHGHGGQLHRFVLGPAQFAELKQGKRVYVTTTVVDGHMHDLFIDPVDPAYRVQGAPPVEVPLGLCS